MGKERGIVSRIIFTAILSLALGLPILVETAVAQPPSNYYVTVNPSPSNSPRYTPVGSNWNVSFQTLWSYGDNQVNP